MLIKILIGVAAVLVVLLVIVAARPAQFHIERSIVIAADPEGAFAQVNDFRAWTAWSPYEKLDPAMKKTFGATVSGKGATYAWSGNAKAGEGRMTIERSDRPSTIGIDLEFVRPFAGRNAATFTFVPLTEGTKVTWALDGRNTFAMKAVALFLDMDKLVGSEFARGLAALKNVVESAAPAAQELSTARPPVPAANR